MIRVANRAGSAFWSAADWSTGLIPWLAPARAAANATAPRPVRVTEPPLAPRPPLPSPPPSPRGARACALVSHPVTLDSDSESQVSAASSDALCVTPRACPPPPAGLHLHFHLQRDIAAPMQLIADTICESNNGRLWIDHCAESRLLTMTTTGPIAYHRYELPLVGGRDSVTRTTCEVVDANTLKISVQPWTSSLVDVPPGTTRLPWVQGSFILTALDADTTRVEHISHLVLGGRIPGWLAPVMRRKRPKTLDRLAAFLAG